MRPQTILVVLVALVTAAGLALLARSFMRPTAMPAPQIVAQKEAPTVRILVAANHIGPGEFLKPDLFDWKPWPKGALDDRFITKDQFKETDVVGAVAKQPLEKGDPIFNSKIIKPGQGGFLAAVLKPGMRAVSVNVNRATGNAGLIMPGDLVDLVLTGKVESANSVQQADQYVGETVLHKLRVLAIDQTLDTKDQAQVAQTATLEVTPKDAERVLVAEQLGQLSLILRSLAVADAKDKDGKVIAEDVKPGLTWDRDVSLALKQRGNGPRQAVGGAAPARPSIVVMRGNGKTTNVSVAAPAAPSAPPLAASAVSPDLSAALPSQ